MQGTKSICKHQLYCCKLAIKNLKINLKKLSIYNNNKSKKILRNTLKRISKKYTVKIKKYILLKVCKEYLNEWKVIPHTWIGRQYNYGGNTP